MRESPLASQLDVSRSSVREALRRLEAESLVEMASHRGARVATLVREDALEICDLHILLESHCMRRVQLPISPGERAELERIVEKIRALDFPNEIDQFIELDIAFHSRVMSLAEQRWALHIWSNINPLLGILMTFVVQYLDLNSETIAERHQAIVDGLCQDDPERLVAVINEHYRSLSCQLECLVPVDRDLGGV